MESLTFYRARIGPNKEDRIWNNISQITKILQDLEDKKDEIGHLQLSENSINLEVSKALAEKIRNLVNLTHADFSDIFVGRCKEELPSSLNTLVEAIDNKNIVVLNLSDNAFGPSGVKAVKFYLEKTNSLKELYIENCGLGPEGAELLVSSLEANKNLQLGRLKIGRNRLENKGANAFGKFFSGINTLVEFVAFQNGIKEEGMTNLLKGLKSNTKLQIVKVNDNLITESSVDALVDLLNSLNELRVIDISDSNLGSENALRVFEQLMKCPNLKEIYANYNDIEDKETQNEISDLILKHPNVIEKLVLRGNEIRKAIFKKIVRSKKVIDTDCYSENEMEQDELNELMDELKLC